MWGVDDQKVMCHQEIEIRRHSTPLDTTRLHPSINSSFDTTPHRLHSRHVMAPIVPRYQLFQKSSHKDRGVK